MTEVTVETGDRRVQRSKAKVLEVTYELLTQAGVSGVSVDEVTRRSGVSKTTIYRHWPSRHALLLDACAMIGEPVSPPDTGSWRGDAAALASYLAEQLQTGSWPTILPSIIDAAERDREVADMQAALYRRFTDPFYAVATRAAERGELPPGVDAHAAVTMISGPLFYRRYFSKETIDEGLLSALVAGVTRPAA